MHKLLSVNFEKIKNVTRIPGNDKKYLQRSGRKSAGRLMLYYYSCLAATGIKHSKKNA
jgi:hypothetical protein